MRTISRPLALIGLLVLVGCTAVDPSPSASPSAEPTPTPSPPSIVLDVTVVQENLSIPWDIAFAPDGRMFVSERSGRIQVFASGEPDAELLQTVEVPDVYAIGEAGVMGLAIDRQFDEFPHLYVCASRDPDGDAGPEPWENHLLRYVVSEDDLTFDGRVFDQPMNANRQHNGCAVEMDEAGVLWLTMGDSIKAQQGWPQMLDRLNGKVLRVNRDGSIPEGNPTFPGEDGPGLIYSIGHRNPQGVAFNPANGDTYTVEHGPTVNDEINRIVAGGNYGWPCYTATDTIPDDIGGHENVAVDCGDPDDYLPAIWASGDPTIANSGMTFVTGDAWGPWDGNMLVTTLRENDVRRFEIDADGVPVLRETLLDGAYGRLRAIVQGPDGALYISTSNASNLSQAGMTPAPESFADVIVRVAPAP